MSWLIRDVRRADSALRAVKAAMRKNHAPLPYNQN
jgi:hypothetical protein